MVSNLAKTLGVLFLLGSIFMDTLLTFIQFPEKAAVRSEERRVGKEC